MQIAPYGAWKSPISTHMMTRNKVKLAEPQIDGDSIYWLEGRPEEEGRNCLLQYHDQCNTIQDLMDAPWHARSRVYEYGGGSYLVKENQVFFIQFDDQQIYQWHSKQDIRAITNHLEMRFAECQLDSKHQMLIAICEDESSDSPLPEHSLVQIDIPSGDIQKLHTGHDFYSTPRISPDGSKLSWLTWDHPNMPWDQTQLWVADRSISGSLTNIQMIAGGNQISIFQPEWSPDGQITFISDQSGWWNLYRWTGDRIHPILEMEAEFGLSQFFLGQSTYSFLSSREIIATYTLHGQWHLVIIDIQDGSVRPIETDYTWITGMKASHGKAVFLAGSPTMPPSVIRYQLDTNTVEVLKQSFSNPLDDAMISIPTRLSYPTTDSTTKAHAFFYPPTHSHFKGPKQEKPPVLVISHGGPTSSTNTVLQLEIQFWTSRGLAVLDVNYGGSTGYGRAYRERLRKQWGIVDIDDCIAGAQYVIDQGWVDRRRTAIRGWSAGGYTTLAALTFRDFFQVGASYYGVSDLEQLTTQTHKFESQYLDQLVGPYPEMKNRYHDRSPLYHADQVTQPMIFFQGLEDRIVPPNQAESMVKALQNNQIPVRYFSFPGEAHGFTQAHTIETTFKEELSFYARHFSFPFVDPVPQS